MADTAGGAFGKIIEQMAYDTVVEEYVVMNYGLNGAPLGAEPHYQTREELRAKGRAFADRLVAEGKLMDFLEATAPKPCECCGRV